MIEILMLLSAIFIFLYYFLPKEIFRFVVLVFTTFIGYFLNAAFLGEIFPFTEIIFLLFFGICLFLIFSARKFKPKYVIVFILSTITLLFLFSLIPGKLCGSDEFQGKYTHCKCDGFTRLKFFFLSSETECIGDILTCYEGKIPVPCESLFNSDFND